MSGRVSGWRWAIGEIFIVVVGILIALGVNSWRQSLADRHTETQYLRSLLKDLDNDSTELAWAEHQARVYERAGWTVLGVLHGEKAAIPGDSLALAVEYAGFLYFPAYFPYTFSELVNTGNLRIIRNPKLRRAIAAYYNLIDSEKQW